MQKPWEPAYFIPVHDEAVKTTDIELFKQWFDGDRLRARKAVRDKHCYYLMSENRILERQFDVERHNYCKVERQQALQIFAARQTNLVWYRLRKHKRHSLSTWMMTKIVTRHPDQNYNPTANINP
jgi:hypothetical protein